MNIPLVDLKAQYNSIKDEIDEAIYRVVEDGQFILGPEVEAFENEMAAYCDTKFAIGVASGTDALLLALLACDIKPGDEVLVPTITFVSTAHAISYCGATPIFVDVEPDTLNIDLEDAESRITEKTSAIIPVHYGGHACRMNELWQLADKHCLIVIEDAAHACGSTYRDTHIGGLRSDATCFSFHAVKNPATGDGGGSDLCRHRPQPARLSRV